MLMSDLSIVVRGSQVFATRKLSGHGVNAAEEAILMYLFGHDNSNQDSIAKFFMIDKGSVARTLAKLEKKGFIVRKVNEENQREKVITVTEKSQSIRDVLVLLLVEWKQTMYEGVSADEIIAFETIVGKIATNVTNKFEEAQGGK